ncbi:MAG: hypothetical protein K8F27_08490 [Sulfuricellaceae bacterium]|nr:hypothetical protein [Sulfuricellaceae bacterium]
MKRDSLAASAFDGIFSRSRPQLIAFLLSALDSARSGIKCLDTHNAIWQEEIDPVATLADKVVVETLLFVMLARRIEALPDAVHASLDDLCGACNAWVRNPKNAMLLTRHPHTAVTLGIGHVALTQSGYIDNDFDSLVRRAFSSGRIHAIERLPYRAMEVLWLKSQVFQQPSTGLPELLPASLLVAPAHPVYMTEADCYALTHALMYLTDFGRNGLPPSVSPIRLRRLLDAALAWNILGENLDLLGELLMAHVFIGGLSSPYARFAWHMLAATWTQFGFLPCPSLDPKQYQALSGDEALAYAFKHTYHTTYVGGILCALLLDPPRADALSGDSPTDRWDFKPLADKLDEAIAGAQRFLAAQGESAWPAGDEPAAEPTSSTRDALALVALRMTECRTLDKAHSRQWTKVLADAPIGHSELALILSDGLLIHAAKEYELGVLSRVLADRTRGDLPVSATFLEAAEFLADQQLPNGAIGAHFAAGEQNAAALSVALTKSMALALVSVSGFLRRQAAYKTHDTA